VLDWIFDRVAEVRELEGVHLVTNSRYAQQFIEWAGARGDGVVVHDDGTTSNDDRLGAIGDIAFAVERGGLEGDDLLVIAGDNLIEFSLEDYVAFWRRKDGPASALGVYDVGDLELATHYGIVELDGEDRVIGLVEKPADPPSTLAATATYIYDRAHVDLLDEYLAGGGSTDAPGNLLVWLHTRAPVYGYRFEGGWFDIGNLEQLQEADTRLRVREGLPVRAAYTPDP
jgi:glucose-1-phosphate thymidylyltransferase